MAERCLSARWPGDRQGWPTIVLLGAAYGVIESGLVDTSMFNQQFETYDFSLMTIEAVGVSVYWFPYFVFIHAVWSISVPIAIVETCVPQRRPTPWLGNFGLGIAALIYVSGAVTIGWIIRTEEGLSISPGEFAAASVLAFALVVAAFAVGRAPVDVRMGGVCGGAAHGPHGSGSPSGTRSLCDNGRCAAGPSRAEWFKDSERNILVVGHLKTP